ncbi:glutamine synthetase catalytic region [Acidimicrobium ferrooxidans DSM 10331]|uniref:Glutamine synthetase catalytic region n=1 Tax=Acidimicrobium ferrooxidans (strain DSM 10331 / JCM 15462 / NBRC 103882 / ICP) TaxID=525909 RepID=C7M2G7_ACIFD|nr:glutamine synthetase family protein [Acidimicrobium ferrooxidans]ACU53211.1 glutamine synthetase catalytic region [Acidimicrobium ferrooxidans DSM 10331]
MPDQRSVGVDYVRHMAEDRRVKFIQLWFTDVLGIPRAFQITQAELATALDEGMTFDGSAIDGFSRIHEADVLAMPDPATFSVVPGLPSTARMFCDILNLDRTPFEGCPRNVLRRQIDRARQQGYLVHAAPELEYFYLRETTPGHWEPLDHGSYFELRLNDLGSELRREAVVVLEELGIPVKHSQHEDAPSQHEIDLAPDEVLQMADAVISARLVVTETARAKGITASFMPKPFEGLQGSGMHTHLALYDRHDEEHNAFFDPEAPDGLSRRARSFVAGLLRHAREITAVTNQWVNSYKRLVPGFEAPMHVAWARNNRSALVRVPSPEAARGEDTFVEYRAPDAGANPYLALALMVAAGLQGIEQGYELPPEVHDNLFTMPERELASLGIARLPQTLSEALEELEASPLVRSVLGDHVTEWFLRNKRDEWRASASQVSDAERARYLTLI